MGRGGKGGMAHDGGGGRGAMVGVASQWGWWW